MADTILKLACFPRSLAATRRGFTFYVADPSAPFTNSHQMIQQHGSSVTQFATIRLIGVVTALVIPLFIAAMQVQAQTQAAMNAQARADFKRTDAELNKTYEAVLKKLPDDESKQKLKESQRAWLAFRDAEAAFAADEAHGGSMAPTLRYETMAELTEQRITQLKSHLEE
jgi:uncharacterized protein YecT (DUF1311 family)